MNSFRELQTIYEYTLPSNETDLRYTPTSDTNNSFRKGNLPLGVPGGSKERYSTALGSTSPIACDEEEKKEKKLMNDLVKKGEVLDLINNKIKEADEEGMVYAVKSLLELKDKIKGL